MAENVPRFNRHVGISLRILIDVFKPPLPVLNFTELNVVKRTSGFGLALEAFLNVSGEKLAK